MSSTIILHQNVADLAVEDDVGDPSRRSETTEGDPGIFSTVGVAFCDAVGESEGASEANAVGTRDGSCEGNVEGKRDGP